MKLLSLLLTTQLIYTPPVTTTIHNITNHPITLFEANQLQETGDFLDNISSQLSIINDTSEQLNVTEPFVYIATHENRNMVFHGPFRMRGLPYLVQTDPADDSVHISEVTSEPIFLE